MLHGMQYKFITLIVKCKRKDNDNHIVVCVCSKKFEKTSNIGGLMDYWQTSSIKITRGFC